MRYHNDIVINSKQTLFIAKRYTLSEYKNIDPNSISLYYYIKAYYIKALNTFHTFFNDIRKIVPDRHRKRNPSVRSMRAIS